MPTNIDKRLVSTALILLAAFLGVKTLLAVKEVGQPSAALNTIVVAGDGEAFATPDIAEFSFTVSTDAKTVGDAQDSVTGKIDAVLNALKSLGIEDKDIRTTDYSVYPKYTYQQAVCSNTYCPPGRQIPDGYTVSHSITVKVRKTDNAGQALALAGSKGATNISSLSFTVDDPDKLQSQARDIAVTKARDKAKTLAKSLGVRLGRVVDFNENNNNPWIYPLAYKADAVTANGASSAPTIPTGQNKVTSNVTITYEIR